MKQLWIFQVRNGEAFQAQVKGNPIMKHDGKLSILRCLCTKEEATELEETFRGHGCAVESNCPMETSEQNTERKNIMQVLGGTRPFPCLRCPECAWFDPHLDSLCGAGFAQGEGWDDDAIKGSMSSEKFRNDFTSCPIREQALQ